MLVRALTVARKVIETRSSRSRFRRWCSTFGSTGLLPDEIETKSLSAERLGEKYHELAFSKDEAEGTYFEVGSSILGIYAKNEYFSTDKGRPPDASASV